MKYFRFRLFEFLFWVFLTVVYTLMVWYVGQPFGLNWDKSLSLVVASYLIWQYNRAAQKNNEDTETAIRNEKIANSIVEEVNKTLEANSEENKLEEYRKSFGYNEKK